MVIFVIEVDDLDFFAVKAERHPPIFCNGQAPRSLAVAGQHMGFPAWHGAKLLLLLHFLEERDYALHLDNDAGLQPASG